MHNYFSGEHATPKKLCASCTAVQAKLLDSQQVTITLLYLKVYSRDKKEKKKEPS